MGWDGLATCSRACSNYPMDVQRPRWWTYPIECANGHPWGPGRVRVSWRPCQCAPARAVQPRGSGHRMIACGVPGCRSVFFEPPHDSATALADRANHASRSLSSSPPASSAPATQAASTPRPCHGMSLAEGAFADELPWLKWLPAEARAECVTELLDHLLAGADRGLFVPFALTEGPPLQRARRSPLATSGPARAGRPMAKLARSTRCRAGPLTSSSRPACCDRARSPRAACTRAGWPGPSPPPTRRGPRRRGHPARYWHHRTAPPPRHPLPEHRKES
jgi:hypothetical protein